MHGDEDRDGQRAVVGGELDDEFLGGILTIREKREIALDLGKGPVDVT